MYFRKTAAPKKYDHIDFTPPKGVAEAAKKGLEYRQKASPSNKGGLTPAEASKQGIGSGVQRAVNLKNRDTISPEVIKQMRGFLSRSEKSSKISPENKDTPWNDKGYVAWLLWGGDPAVAWVDKIIKQMEAADEKEKQVKKANRNMVLAVVRRVLARKDHLVTYKGKQYRLQWRGPTKYGERARLQFLDGSKEFWVDAHLVSDAGARTESPRLRWDGAFECEECGDFVRPGTYCWETGLRHFR